MIADLPSAGLSDQEFKAQTAYHLSTTTIPPLVIARIGSSPDPGTPR